LAPDPARDVSTRNSEWPKFHESFCQDLTANEALVMAVTQKAPVARTFEDKITAPGMEEETVLVANLKPGSDDFSREPELDVRTPAREQDNRIRDEPCLACLDAR